MRQRAVNRVLKACAHALSPDERIDHVGMAGMVMPKGRSGLTAASVAASGGAGFGLAGALVSQSRKYFLVLTDRRLLFVDMDVAFARPLPNVSFVLPRYGLSARRVSSLVSTTIALHDPNGTEICRLSFPFTVREGAAELLQRIPLPGAGVPNYAAPPYR